MIEPNVPENQKSVETEGKTEKKSQFKSKLSVHFRRIKSSIIFRIAKILVYLGGILGLIYLISTLNIFFVEEITVMSLSDENLHYVSDKAVEKEMLKYIGQRLFSIDTDEAENKLENSFPFAKTIYVTKRFPDSLTVRIQERVPSLVLFNLESEDPNDSNTDLAQGLVFDTEGILLTKCEQDKTPCSLLPVVEVEYVDTDSKVGSKPYIPFLDTILEIQSDLQKLKYKVSMYSVPEKNIAVVELEDGKRIIFSTSKSIDSQISELQITEESLSLEGKVYLEMDLRYDRPVARFDKYTEWVTE